MTKARLLIVDDHLLSRKGIASLLATLPEVEVAGEAGDGVEALEQVRALAPDLVLMDINMPHANGIEATRRIKAEFPEVKVVILSVSDDVQDFFEAIKAGAQGYLHKNMEPETWVEYLRSVIRGDAPISRPLAARILKEFALDDPAGGEGALPTQITGREREVLEQVAQGLSNREIADRLSIAETTVKNHLRNILTKLHLRNRVELAAYAYEKGLVRPSNRDGGPRAH